MLSTVRIQTKSAATPNPYEDVSKSFDKAHDVLDGEGWRSIYCLGKEKANVKRDRDTSPKEQTSPLSSDKFEEQRQNQSSTAKIKKIRSVIENIRERRLQRVHAQEKRESLPARKSVGSSREQNKAVNDTKRSPSTSNDPVESPVPISYRKRKSRIIQQVKNHARFEQHLIDKMHDVNMLLSMAKPGSEEEKRLIAEQQSIDDSKVWAQEALAENLHFLASKTRTSRKSSGDAKSGSETKPRAALKQEEVQKAHFPGSLTQNLQSELDIMTKVVSKLLAEAKHSKSQNPTFYVLNKELEYTKEKIRNMELGHKQILKDLERTKRYASRARVEEDSKLAEEHSKPPEENHKPAEENSKLAADVESSRTKIRDAELKNQQVMRDSEASKQNPAFIETSSSTQHGQLDGETVKRSNKQRSGVSPFHHHKKRMNSTHGRRPTGMCNFAWQKLDPIGCNGGSFPVCNYTDGAYRPDEALSQMSDSCDPSDGSNRNNDGEPNPRKYWHYRSGLRPFSTRSSASAV